MCHALFIAATVELPLVPAITPPSFSVEMLHDRSVAIAGRFPAGWHIRYAGSTSGCGCDFHGDGSQTSRTALADYLRTLPAAAQVQIYDCWEGDEAQPVEDRVSSTAAAVAASDDLLAERRLITITNH